MTPTLDRYRGEAGRSYQAEKRAIPDAALPWVARDRAAKLQPYVAPDSLVLEYGVGLGWNLAALVCQRRIGFDPGEFLEPALARQGIEFVPGTASLPEALADVVLCHHTLEHVLQPAAALAEMRRLLKPGGRLLIFVPLDKERRHRRFRRDEPNHHLYSWTAQTLGNLIEDCEFIVETATVAGYGYDRFGAVWAHRLRLGETGFRLVRAAARLAQPLLEVRVIARRG